MPEVLAKLQRQLKDLWSNLDKSQKNRIYITSGILIIVLTAAIVMLTRTSYVPLMTIADPKDAAEIEKVLQEKNIKYKPDGGGRIVVDSKDKNKAEFALASSGLTTGGMTFEDAWNMVKISSTESDKKQLWNNFKKNSLIAKLKMFDNVKDADIDLTQPEKTLFFQGNSPDDEKAKAYVKISPKGEISPEQVQGIVRVVASSIEGLDPKNVTVVDNNFNILNTDMSGEMGLPTNQFKLKLKVKDEIEKNVKRLYPGKSDAFDYISVVANPVLELDKVNSTKNEITKPTGMDEAIISSEEHTEKLENGTPNGAPGTDSNPGANTQYPISGDGNSNYEKESKILNYGYTNIMTEVEKAIGTVSPEKSSMTVALWYGQRVKDDSKITDQFIARFAQDVSNATGIPVTNISVTKYPLAPEEVIPIPVTDTIKKMLDEYGFFALMLILVVGLMIAALPRRKKEKESELVPELASANGPKFIVPESEEALPEIELEDRSEVKKQLDRFVKQKPEAVANLLRNWLSDEWD